MKTRAVVIKSQRYGEADRIVTFYTEKLGKIRGIAKGARRLKSRLGGGLEPFGFIDLTIFEKSPEILVRISQVDIINSFGKIREDLTVMTAAAHMVNLIKAITPDRDPHSSIFNTLIGGLEALQDEGDPELCSLVFQVHVLGQTGFRPQTDHCSGCNSDIEVAKAQFSPQSGGLVCRSCRERIVDRCFPMSPGSLAFIQQARRLPFPTVTRLRAAGQIRREVEEVIDSYVHHVIGKPLPTISWWAAEPSPPAYTSS
ncbi:MAG: DNA repair protein RecO [Nitrospirota bacterium]|nr:MAG: DNA repair protein RecO [Nitrospirota bacterium]